MTKRDYSVRIPTTQERLEILEAEDPSPTDLPPIQDMMFKPKGVDMTEYHPGEIAVRLREFVDSDKDSTLMELKTILTDDGYTDKRKIFGEGRAELLISKAQEMGYEEWGRMQTRSKMYDLDVEGAFAKVLYQQIGSVGSYLKLESPTQAGLAATLELLSVSEEKRIRKNATVLLAEQMRLIKRTV